jgi:hypothetical protein
MSSRLHPFALLVAMLALVSQLALGATVLPDDAPHDAPDDLAAIAILCGTPAPDHHAPPHPAAPDWALLPLSVALALPAVILTPTPLLPRAPAALVFRAGTRPRARAPPPVAVAAAYPRGPPILA